MPLADLRILDLSRLLPGPLCSMILADMGAEVLKIEDTKLGDYMRTMGTIINKDSAEFLMLNRNKKSMKLNLQSDAGKEIFLQLAAEYDVILEGFRPGVMDRLGVGYEDVKKVNSKIIYCSLTGYGQSGPYKNMAGHDANYLSIAGVLDSIGIRDGSPVIPGVQIGDVGGGSLWAALAILIAWIDRKNNGRGQYLDVAMVDGLMPFLSLFASAYFVNGEIPKRGESGQSGGHACMTVYETKDGRYGCLAAAEPQFWSAFCHAVERPELISDQYAPLSRQLEMIGEIQAIMKTKTQTEWVDILLPLDACFTPIKNIGEAFEDPHIQARNMVLEIDHPVEGKIKTIAFPVKFSEISPQALLPPPSYGEHTLDVIKGLGYDDEHIEKIKQLKVI